MTLKYAQGSLTVVSPESCRVAMYVKYSEDSERMKRKSPFSTTPLSFDSLQRTHANICINLILPETTFPGHKLPSPKQILTQNGHSRSFKVIYLGIIEKPLMDYRVQYNKCGLRCEGSEDIASERSENLHFRPPHSHLTPPLQRTPVNIPIWLT